MNLHLITTTFPHNRKRVDEQLFAFIDDPGVENDVVNLYPEITSQTFDGFGGAFTDSAGYVFSLMPPAERQALLNAYFDPINGAGYTLGRIPLDSCDFSLEHYEAMSDPNDRAFSSFSLSRSGKYILPLIAEAQKTLGKPIDFMGAPWSPPAFMKTTGKRNDGGALKPEYREFWADYLCVYIRELRKAGARVNALTIQNEPKAAQRWDSCVYTTDEEKEFLALFLLPALKKHGLADVELFLWDHNKERAYERARDIFPSVSPLSGLAFHWYSGDHFEAVQLIAERFPGKKLVQSEACIEYYRIDKNDVLTNAQKYAHDIIGDLNAGMTAFYDWNIVLDEEGGPNHVGNFCDAPFLFNTKTGVLEERASYAYLCHFSRYIRPGSKRIAFSRYTDALEMTAFRAADGSIVTVFLNRSERLLPVYLRIAGKVSAILLPPAAISTGILSV
jgi:glucosylceramidase